MKSRKEMSLVLNFLPIYEGGGLQNALSFVDTLLDKDCAGLNVQAVVRCGSEIHQKCEKAGIRCCVVANGRMGRLRFELSCRSVFKRGQVCFTHFGPIMLSSAGYLINVNGCAYCNLFYPDINCWSYLPIRQRIIAEAIDCLRRRYTSRADYWIFETEVLKERAIRLCGFPAERVGVVPMAVSRLVSPEKVNLAAKAELETSLKPGLKFLFLNSANPNKRIHLLPDLAAEMRSRGANDFVFVTTMNPESFYSRDVAARFREMKLERHFQNLGPVAPDRVASLIACADAMCNFCRVESFSNNFIEAWTMQLPLVVTDCDWAKAACGRSALYVNPENLAECALTLGRLMQDANLRRSIVEEGKLQLKKHPTSQEKTRLYFEAIDRACSLGFCERSLQNSIRWPRMAW
ncbi:MAG: glycosyltransferase family 4 protein [Limisphaerales bacterium]